MGLSRIVNALPVVVIPEGVTTIQEFGFSDCTSLASLTLPSTIEHIWAMVFNGCSALSLYLFPAR
jgi:hypothetical protein